MTRKELFDIWVPEGNLWSAWGKPVLFAEMDLRRDVENWTSDRLAQSLGWLPPRRRAVIILDVPATDAVFMSLHLARHGFRPVPLFNASSGPREIIDLKDLKTALLRGAEELRALSLPADASPIFLLDSRRQEGKQRARPGTFDNRWLVFPQDFPSANFLLAHETREAVVVQEKTGQPARDLAHVLRRWQEAGISIQSLVTGSEKIAPTSLDVKKPSNFRALWYRSLAMFGFRRNSAGGFGAMIPEETGGHGSGFG
jgi:hypothetical protein